MDNAQGAPGIVELDESTGHPRVKLTLPQESFTVSELRSFAAYLNMVADDAEPSPEVSELADLLEVANRLSQSSRATARSIIGAGYSLAKVPAGDERG